MANEKHLEMLIKGRYYWNEWRLENPEILPDLTRANLAEIDLTQANLSRSDLTRVNFYQTVLTQADLTEANLTQADLRGAILKQADLHQADLHQADLRQAYLVRANLTQAILINTNLAGADFTQANLTEANLTQADLRQTTLIKTNLCGSNLTGCSIYGISVWDIQLDGAKQNDLIITPKDQSVITVDNLEVAQFIYLLLNNPKIRDVIDTIAKKAVLILGRFTLSRKPVLEALKTILRSKGYLPILFDFEKPRSQDLTETVSTLAHLSRFIIADLTDPSCSPYEVGLIASNHVKPLKPLFQPSETAHHEFVMFNDLQQRYYWVLPTYQYLSLEDLITSLQDEVISSAEQKIVEIERRKNKE